MTKTKYRTVFAKAVRLTTSQSFSGPIREYETNGEPQPGPYDAVMAAKNPPDREPTSGML
ncbi:MAG: hypothetical protein MUE44_17860 [Oscillatoriaceae cyanobacterium Prado104]|jgi:hypothetical protein|nr:hypothetical protein [Oscillatoriaceae cyanobacterium Prado104]